MIKMSIGIACGGVGTHIQRPRDDAIPIDAADNDKVAALLCLEVDALCAEARVSVVCQRCKCGAHLAEDGQDLAGAKRSHN